MIILCFFIFFNSSTAAIYGDIFEGGRTYNENDWPSIEQTKPYSKSKLLAEKAAWNFVNERKKENKPCFELAVINPGYIMGPLLHDSECTSMEVIRKLLQRDAPMLADVSFVTCGINFFFLLHLTCSIFCFSFSLKDVRDVALAHIKAMTVPEAANNRHIIASTQDSNSMKDFALILDAEFGPKGYSIPTTVAPDIFIKAFGLFDKSVQLVTPWLGKKYRFDNSRMKNILNIQPTPLKNTMIDMANSLIQKGWVKK